MKSEFAATREAIDRVDKSLGGDPFLDVKRAGCYVQEGKLTEADQAARRAIDREPNLLDAWWARVTISLKAREFARTAELLSTLQEKHDVEIADLTTIPAYAEFVKSKEYEKWLAAQSK